MDGTIRAPPRLRQKGLIPMSDDNDLELKIGADASGVAPAAAETNSQVNSIADNVGALAAGMKAMGASAVTAFQESSAAAKENLAAVKEAAEGITEMREMLSGFGEAMMAAFAVEEITEFVSKMGEASEKTIHIAETFGLTAKEVQKMNAEAALFGVPADAMTTAMMRADKSFATAKEGSKAAGAAFKEAGVDINHGYSQTQLLSAALDGLSKMDAGPAKVAAAMAIFGKNIQEIGPLINLTKEQIEEADATIAAYGAVNDVAAMKGLALAESLNVSKVAGKGIANVFTDAMAPAFQSIVEGCNELAKGFIQSYNTGGTAKTVMDALTWTVKALADVVGLAGLLIVDSFKAVDAAAYVIEAGFDALGALVTGVCHTMMDSFRSFGDVARDALTFNWGAISGDITSGATRVAADVANTAKEMGKAAAENFKKGADEWESTNADASNYEAWSKKLWGGGDKPKEGPKEGTGTTDQDPSAAPKAGGGGHGKAKGKPPTIDTPDDSIDFSADIAAWTDATKQKIGLISDQEAAQKKASADQIAGVEDAQKRGVISAQQANDQIDAIILQQRDDAIAAAMAIRDARIAADQKTMAFSDSSSADFKRAQHDMTQAAIDFEKARSAADSTANSQLVTAARKTADEIQAAWQKSISGVVSAFGSGVEGMINGTGSLRQAMLKVGQDIESSMFRAVESMVTNWATGEMVKTGLSGAGAAQRGAIETTASLQSKMLSFETAEKDIFNAAAKAAANAYAAMAGIPIIGPELGAVAAAVTFSAVEGFGNIASAAGGYDIPSGINPLVQTHANEMILPAHIANPMRSLLQGVEQTGGIGGGGETHNHNYNPVLNISAVDHRGVQAFFDQHADKLFNTINAKVRGGAKIAGV